MQSKSYLEKGAKQFGVKSSKKKTLTIRWKKAKNISGYQIQYATNKKFKKAKKKTVKSTFVTLKKLKKKKTYYVRIRTYKKLGNTYYSGWSSAKKVKINK